MVDKKNLPSEKDVISAGAENGAAGGVNVTPKQAEKRKNEEEKAQKKLAEQKQAALSYADEVRQQLRDKRDSEASKKKAEREQKAALEKEEREKEFEKKLQEEKENASNKISALDELLNSAQTPKKAEAMPIQLNEEDTQEPEESVNDAPEADSEENKDEAPKSQPEANEEPAEADEEDETQKAPMLFDLAMFRKPDEDGEQKNDKIFISNSMPVNMPQQAIGPTGNYPKNDAPNNTVTVISNTKQAEEKSKETDEN